jgi:uncharacterized membrane protein
MPPELILPLIARWIHILSAIAAIGAPFFIRFALIPAAAKVLNEEQHQRLREAINARWKHVVYLLITLFILTGLYMFAVPVRVQGVLVTARWKDFSPTDQRIYQAIFGIKMIAALAIFFLASALAGRTKALEPIRKQRKIFLSILLMLGIIAVICAGIMRYLPQNPPYTPLPPTDLPANMNP